MNKAFKLFIFYLFLAPFYIFESGLPQPADFLLFIICFFVFIFVDKKIFLINPIKSLLRFILLVVVVNVFNQFDLHLSGLGTRSMLAPIFYIYNFLVFTLIFIFWKRIEQKKFLNTVSFIIILTLSIQLLLHLLGIGIKGGRALIFFNNPNQLGYYTLCMVTLFAVIPSKYRSKKTTTFIVLLISSYLVLVSGSRAALFGVLLLGTIIFLKEGFKFKISTFLWAFILLLISIVFISRSEKIQRSIQSLNERNQDRNTSISNEIKVRGYDRIFLYPEYLIYGAGEGGEQRYVKAHSQLEMHSGFGTILFSYGFFGSLLFLVFIYKIMKPNLIGNLFLLLPVFSYNFSHQGFRNTQLWILFAFIYLVSLDEKSRKNS